MTVSNPMPISSTANELVVTGEQASLWDGKQLASSSSTVSMTSSDDAALAAEGGQVAPRRTSQPLSSAALESAPCSSKTSAGHAKSRTNSAKQALRVTFSERTEDGALILGDEEKAPTANTMRSRRAVSRSQHASISTDSLKKPRHERWATLPKPSRPEAEGALSTPPIRNRARPKSEYQQKSAEWLENAQVVNERIERENSELQRLVSHARRIATGQVPSTSRERGVVRAEVTSCVQRPLPRPVAAPLAAVIEATPPEAD